MQYFIYPVFLTNSTNQTHASHEEGQNFGEGKGQRRDNVCCPMDLSLSIIAKRFKVYSTVNVFTTGYRYRSHNA